MSLPEVPGTKETIDALKGTPMLLVLMIVIAVVLAMVTFLVYGRSQSIDKEKSELIGLLKECMSDKPTKTNEVFSPVHRFWYLNKK